MEHSPLCIPADADTGEDGGGTGADILAHDDRNCHPIGDTARQGQGLQHAHRCRGALDHRRDDQAGQHAQNRISEGGEQAREDRGFRQGRDGAAHQGHAVDEESQSTQERNERKKAHAASVFSQKRLNSASEESLLRQAFFRGWA